MVFVLGQADYVAVAGLVVEGVFTLVKLAVGLEVGGFGYGVAFSVEGSAVRVDNPEVLADYFINIASSTFMYSPRSVKNGISSPL